MSTISISSETLSVFKKLYEIDQSLKIASDQVETKTDSDGNEKKVTVVRTKSANKTMMARVEIDEVFPRDLHIYDLREFISVVNIVKEPQFDFSDEKFVVIRSADDKQKLRYLEANPDLIKSFIDKDLSLSNDDVEVVITAEQFKSVLTAAQTMRLNHIGFVSDGETLSISAFGMNNGDGKDTNNFNNELVECDKTFRMFYKLDVHNIQVLLGEGDLTITIDGKRKVSKVETQSGKVLWIAFDSKSEFED